MLKPWSYTWEIVNYFEHKPPAMSSWTSLDISLMCRYPELNILDSVYFTGWQMHVTCSLRVTSCSKYNQSLVIANWTFTLAAALSGKLHIFICPPPVRIFCTNSSRKWGEFAREIALGQVGIGMVLQFLRFFWIWASQGYTSHGGKGDILHSSPRTYE